MADVDQISVETNRRNSEADREFRFIYNCARKVESESMLQEVIGEVRSILQGKSSEVKSRMKILKSRLLYPPLKPTRLSTYDWVDRVDNLEDAIQQLSTAQRKDVLERVTDWQDRRNVVDGMCLAKEYSSPLPWPQYDQPSSSLSLSLSAFGTT